MRLRRTSDKRPGAPGRSWSGRRDSNPRPPPWQGGALPTEPRPRVRPEFTSGPGRSEPPGAPLGPGQLLGPLGRERRDGHDDELRDSVPAGDPRRRPPIEVHHGTGDLTTVARVDKAGPVCQRNAM